MRVSPSNDDGLLGVRIIATRFSQRQAGIPICPWVRLSLIALRKPHGPIREGEERCKGGQHESVAR